MKSLYYVHGIEADSLEVVACSILAREREASRLNASRNSEVSSSFLDVSPRRATPRMQTFLPFACVLKSLRCLDHKRLHKQLTEAIQILRIIALMKQGEEPKYRNHPAVLMWVGHETYLRYYACCCSQVIRESTRRVKDGEPYDTRLRDLALREELGGWLDKVPVDNTPAWFGKDEFHASHRAALYRKRPDLYGEFQADSLLHEEYHWPVRKEKKKEDRVDDGRKRRLKLPRRALSVLSAGIEKKERSSRRRIRVRSQSAHI